MATRTFEASFHTVAGPAQTVLEFRCEHALGRPGEAVIDVHIVDYQDPDDVIGQGATLAYGYADEPVQFFHGLVEAVTVMGSVAEGASTAHHYRFHVVSPLGFLDQSVNCLIFQDMDTKAIVSKVLERLGIASDQQKWNLTGSYLKREYCVQYNESALAFITRLCEDDGIWFHTEPNEAGDNSVVVFADDSSAAPPIAGTEQLPYRQRGGFDQFEDAVTNITLARRVVSGKTVLRDYNFKKPALDLTSEATSDADTDLELYDYPGRYEDAAEGKRRAKIRLDAEQSRRRTVHVEADCARIQIGRQLEITESEAIGGDGKYFVTRVIHSHTAARIGAADGGEGAGYYKCEADLLPVAATFRLAEKTPHPIIAGAQTAKIVAPAGSPDQEIHTDEHGRAKVLFPWDREGTADDKASCWMRVGQLQTSGSMYLPRIHWEVVIQHLEGDPDRPIVTGKLYNGQLMPPYALPAGRTRTAIQSVSTPGGGGMNEIRIEDKAGGEEISINAQYDKNIVTANNKKKTVHANETQNVGVNAETKIGANQTIKITKGAVKNVKADQTVTVGANRKVEVNAVGALAVKGSSTTTVGANHLEMDGNPLEGLIAVATEKAMQKASEAAMKGAANLAGGALAKVNQVMGPVNAVLDRAKAMGGAITALKNGNLGAAAGAIAAASGFPGAEAMGGAMAGDGAGGGAAGGRAPADGAAPGPAGASGSGAAPAGGAPAAGGEPAKPKAPAGAVGAGLALANKMIGSALRPVAQKGVRKVAKALEGGGGGEGADGGGSSAANAGGPEGAVAGIDAADREKGPGHSTHKVDGTLSETVGAMKVVAALNGINTNVAAAMTQSVGAAKVEMVYADLAEAVGSSKTETEVALIVVAKEDETESAGAMKSEMVGGAIAEKIGGNHTVVAGAMATFIGALHKIDAKGKITFKCGASSVVVDGSGITITSPMVMITAAKIQIPKSTTEQ